ncbi:hypothetical protein Ct61P_15108 [Colletotrichum tofieldiae]|nr:hypothetical protein Ct61P_15108 [Colletotrichum tofieldiae]
MVVEEDDETAADESPAVGRDVASAAVDQAKAVEESADSAVGNGRVGEDDTIETEGLSQSLQGLLLGAVGEGEAGEPQATPCDSDWGQALMSLAPVVLTVLVVSV